MVWLWKTRGLWRRWWRVLAAGVIVGERRNWFAEERERFTVAFGGRLVVLLASYGGVGGGEAGGGWNGRKREGEKKLQK